MNCSAKPEVIKCRAAICWAPKMSMTVEDIEVQPPKAKEVRIKVIANSICHSDTNVYSGRYENEKFVIDYPCILGHEATGVVESIGDEVTSVSVGDHVLTVFNGQCRECDYCKNPKTNLCLKNNYHEKTMTDQATRFICKGKPVYQFCGISSLSEYTVIAELQVIKINPKVRMDRVCIFSCGFATGYGSVLNVGQVDKGSTVAVWGLGPIGLSAVYGAKICGAKTIIGVDINESKFRIARKMGCTHFVNPLQCKTENKATAEVIKSMTNDVGLDFVFECVGEIPVVKEAFNSLSPWGTMVQVGVTGNGKTVDLSPNEFLSGKKITGALLGGYKSQDSIPKLVEQYVNGVIDIEDFFSGSIQLDAVNDAFERLMNGEVLRTVVLY